MAGISTGLKKKLTINSCIVNDDGTVTVEDGKSFEVQLNPSSYKDIEEITYSEEKTLGQIGQNLKFSAIAGGKMSIVIVLDGTGVVNLPIPGVGSPDVKKQIKNLKDIVFKYDGDEHEPNHVRLLWGDMVFFGRLKKMSVDYTLFKPSGLPLRAKVAMDFIGFMTSKEQSLRAGRSSPDLTHIIVWKAGDTLPRLCYRIYKDCSYYLKVARVNNVTCFRDIKPGTKIFFPPLG